jgi:hypothetical protein
MTNGIDSPPEIEAPQLLSIRAEVLRSERLAIIREREILIVRYRVQKRIGADQARLDEITQALERDELALAELEAIAREWGLSLNSKDAP